MININTEYRVKQFEAFNKALMGGMPESYKPHYFVCNKEGKDPAPFEINKVSLQKEKTVCCNEYWISVTKKTGRKSKKSNECPACNSNSYSWKQKSARLTYEEAISYIRKGFNIGLGAMKYSEEDFDPLVIVDIDNENVLSELKSDTLTDISRKRVGKHLYFKTSDVKHKTNYAFGIGEIRSQNEYVLVPGSYVPFSEEDIDKQIKEGAILETSRDHILNDYYRGFYTLDRAIPTQEFSFNLLPQSFQDLINKPAASASNINAEKPAFTPKKITSNDLGYVNPETGEIDGFSSLSELEQINLIPINNLVGDIESSRTGHPLHSSDTDANWTILEDNLGCCFRHNVTLSPLQLLGLLMKKEEGENINDLCSVYGTGFKSKDNNNNNPNHSILKTDKSLVKKIINKMAILRTFLDEELKATPFCDQDNILYLSINFNGLTDVYRLKDGVFQSLIIDQVRLNKNLFVKKTDIKDVLATYEYSCLKNPRNIYLRVGEKNKKFYYDLSNDAREVVEITPNGWSVVPDPVLFKRYNDLKPVEISNQKVNLDIIFDFLNVQDEEHKCLIKTYIVSLFIPEIQKPILEMYGTEGSGKSTASKLIKILCDPSAKLTIRYKKYGEDELVRQFNKTYFCVLDNLSEISDETNDILARAITGETDTVRELYTDDDDVIRSFKRPVMLNGRTVTGLSSDVMERKIIINLERLEDNKRLGDKELMDTWFSVVPGIRSYIFDIVSQSMALYGVHDWELMRMADFHKWGEFISRVLGYDELFFTSAYKNNLASGSLKAVEGDALSDLVLQYCESKLIFREEISPSSLVTALSSFGDSIGYTSKELEKVLNRNKIRSSLERSSALFAKSGWLVGSNKNRNGINIVFQRRSGPDWKALFNDLVGDFTSSDNVLSVTTLLSKTNALQSDLVSWVSSGLLVEVRPGFYKYAGVLNE